MTTGLFGAVGLAYGVLVPVVLIQITALLLVPSLLRGNARPDEAARAIFAYLVQSAGIVFMSLGGLPALYAVLARQPLSNALYTALLFVFAFGGVAFLWADTYARRVDFSSRQVMEAIHLTIWKFVGFMTIFLSSLTFLLRLVLSETAMPENWWVLHAVMFFYGVLVSWCTKTPVKKPVFNSAPMVTKAPGAALMPQAGKKAKKK